MFNKNIISYCCFYLFLFIIFFVFFSQVHPLLPFDTDDWMYIGLTRPPYPTFSQWNPAKLLPECLQPLIGFVAAYIVTPIIGDYIHALIYTNAFVVSSFIIGYLFSVQTLIKRKYSISNYSVFFIITIYTLLHFLALKTATTNNEHLWYSRDVNCYYNYIIPNMLCASLVIWLMTHDYRKLKSSISISILAFTTFMALFSNLYSTVILIAYIGATLTLDIFTYNKKQQKWLLKFIKFNYFYLIIIVGWFVVQLFEANGNRATSYGYQLLPFKDSLIESLKCVLFKTHFNDWFLLFCIGSIICAKICNYLCNHRFLYVGKQTKSLIIALILSLSYLILLSSRVFPRYLLKGDVIFSYIFFFLLLVVLSLAYLCSRIRLVKIICPFLVFFFFFMTNAKQNSFKDLHSWNKTDLYTCEKFDRDMVNQLKKAEVLGKDTVIIYVHNYNEGTNWPLNLEFGEYIGLTLHKHGIIRRKITTIFKRKPTELDSHNYNPL